MEFLRAAQNVPTWANVSAIATVCHQKAAMRNPDLDFASRILQILRWQQLWGQARLELCLSQEELLVLSSFGLNCLAQLCQTSLKGFRSYLPAYSSLSRRCAWLIDNPSKPGSAYGTFLFSL